MAADRHAARGVRSRHGGGPPWRRSPRV